MKKRILTLLGLLLATMYIVAKDNPRANNAAVVEAGQMRFTILTPQLIRMEWSADLQFTDNASLAFINRELPVPKYSVKKTNSSLEIKTEALTLKYKLNAKPEGREQLSISMKLDGKSLVWYPGLVDDQNLLGTTRTLDGMNGYNFMDRMEQGLVSRSGWSLVDDSHTPLFDGAKDIDWVQERLNDTDLDWYFFGYGHDYKRALADFTQVAGKISLPPMYVFGYWYSKYSTYSDQDFRDIVADLERFDIPTDIMILDMDWHDTYGISGRKGNMVGWTGYTWNNNLFPSPQKFIDWLHSKNLKTALNLHPASGIYRKEAMFDAIAKDLDISTKGVDHIEWNMENKDFYKSYSKHILQPNEKETGVDFWWLDWQQDVYSKHTKNLNNTFWLNHVFFNDMKLNSDKRPLIFHRWGGLGNHRYQIGFSGDATVSFKALDFEPYFTATAANVGYGYWSHDIGGHHQEGDNDPELYLRWIQYGVFSPIIRTHSSKNGYAERRIWKYPNFDLMNEAIHLRYSLAPYIYTMARKSYDTGLAICYPMYYDYPSLDASYANNNQYMFGDQILVNPVTKRADERTGLSTVNIWLPEGKWYEVATGTLLNGGQMHTRSFTDSEIPYYYKAGAVIPNYPKVANLANVPSELVIQFSPASDGAFMLYEDEMINKNYQENSFATTTISQTHQGGRSVYTISPRQGEFKGMLNERGYQLQLMGMLPPKSVLVNGEEYATSDYNDKEHWTYNGLELTTNINIPVTNCNKEIRVEVTFEQDHEQYRGLLNEKVGQFKRLQRTSVIVKDEIAKVDCCESPSDLFLEVASVQNAISYFPEKTVEKLKFFDANLKNIFVELINDTDINKDVIKKLEAEVLTLPSDDVHIANGTYTISSVLSGNNLSAHRAEILVSDNTQKWIVERLNNGFYKIIASDSGKALALKDGVKKNGAVPTLEKWTGEENQLWKLEKVDKEDSYNLISKLSMKALDIEGQSKANDAKVHQWDSFDGSSQKWLLK